MTDWLEARTRQAPAALRARVREQAAHRREDGSPATRLANAAEQLMSVVEAHPGDRSIALDLLAADALITLALLAVAETRPDQLQEFATGLLTRGAREPR